MAETTCRIALSPEEIDGHFAVRRWVFVDEQKLFVGTDRDAHDDEAIPLVAVDDATGEVIGAVRCYPESNGTWYGGRLAVLPAHRKSAVSIGSALCRLAVATMEECEVGLFLALIQAQNVHFFQRMGWQRSGSPVMHCDRAHQLMKAPLYQAREPGPVHRIGSEVEHGRVAGRAG